MSASPPSMPAPPVNPAAVRDSITTDRLILRRPASVDAAIVAVLLADREVAAGTALIPHPYTLDHARAWLAAVPAEHASGAASKFIITLRDSGVAVGFVSLKIDAAHRRAELGYALGREHWGKGYATEASRAVVDHGFIDLGVNKVFAGHWAWNAPSGAVLEKLGMKREGCVRQHFLRFGRFEDSVEFGLLRSEWEAQRAAESPVARSVATTRLETERLLLRPFTLADAPAIVEVCNDPDVASTTDGIAHPYTLAHAEQFIRDTTRTNLSGESSIFAMCVRDTGEVIGDVGLYKLDAHNRKADLGVVVAQRHWRRGYATEACRAIIRHGFADLDLHRVESGCLPRNVASWKMIERCGFAREGVRREGANQFGVFEDEVVFGLLKSEWIAAEAARISPPPPDASQGASPP